MSMTEAQAKKIKAQQMVSVAAYVQKYQPAKTSIADRIATVLYEISKIAPMQPIDRNLLAKAVLGLATTPNKASPKVKMVSGQIGAARNIMKTKYKQTIWSETGVGVRCTTDDDDRAATRVDQAARALASKHNMLVSEAALVDPTKMKNEERKKWFKSEVVPTTRLLENDGLIRRLIAPMVKKKESDK